MADEDWAARLAAVGIEIAAAPEPVGRYLPYVRLGDMVQLSGISSAADGMLVRGKLGADLGLEEGRAAARRCAANVVRVLSDACDGDLGRVQAVVMLRGFVNAADDFTEVHKVVDAASDLLIALFGPEIGAHARTVIGCSTLPNGNAVTLDVTAQVG